MPTFTVVIPTFNNCKTLRYSITSVLNQAFSDFELFVVGDGCPVESKEIVSEFRQRDDRVIFFDNPKGPRHGELFRHAALQRARGRYVTYLSDDDLFLPHHLSVVLEAFESGAEFVHTLPLHVIPADVEIGERAAELPGLPEKRVLLFRGRIDRPESVRLIQEGRNFLSLSSVSHTRELYERLPHGWRTTPPEVYTDLYMWQQFVAMPGLKGCAIPRATVIHCAKSLRAAWPEEKRLAELVEWSLLIQREGIDLILERAALAIAQTTLVEDEERVGHLKRQIAEAREHDLLLQGQVESARERGSELQKRLAELEERLATEHAEITEALSNLQKIHESRAMRAVERLRRYPVVKQVGRAIASFLSR
jgi:hypothetical protein